MERLPSGEPGTLPARIAERFVVTMYGRVGEWPLLALGLAGAAFRIRSRMRQS
jgi:apolipoprotein N-acyltransferase